MLNLTKKAEANFDVQAKCKQLVHETIDMPWPCTVQVLRSVTELLNKVEKPQA